MLKLKKIAITGGVASGKTSVCQFFKELKAYVVDADAIVHDLLNHHADLGKQLTQYFGPQIIQNGKISRKGIAEIAFKDLEALRRLEKLLHPRVLQKIEEHYSAACNKGYYSAFVVEIPLLFEIEIEKNYDVIITVLADEETAQKRFENAGFSKEQYDFRMKRQLSPKIKAAKSHFIIQNNGSLHDLRKQVVEVNQIIHQQ